MGIVLAKLLGLIPARQMPVKSQKCAFFPEAYSQHAISRIGAQWGGEQLDA